MNTERIEHQKDLASGLLDERLEEIDPSSMVVGTNGLTATFVLRTGDNNRASSRSILDSEQRSANSIRSHLPIYSPSFAVF
jgi:hypothetical protein